MIPLEVETQIALFYFRRYLPEDVDLSLASLLLPYYFDDDEQPSTEEIVSLAIRFLEEALNEYE